MWYHLATLVVLLSAQTQAANKTYSIDRVVSRCDRMTNSKEKKDCYKNAIGIDHTARLLARELGFDLNDLPNVSPAESRTLLVDWCSKNNDRDLCGLKQATMQNRHKREVLSETEAIADGGLWIRDTVKLKFPNEPETSERVYFDVATRKVGELENAAIYFRVVRPSNSDEDNQLPFKVHIYVYETMNRIGEAVYEDTNQVIKANENSTRVDVVSLDPSIVSAMNDTNNFGLMIKVRALNADATEQPILVRDWSSNDGDDNIIMLMTPKPQKSRRTVEDDNSCEFNPTSTCCRRAYELRFSDIGFDHVIAPPVFRIHMCAGQCQSNWSGDENSLHAVLRRKLADVDKKRRNQKPNTNNEVDTRPIAASCCAPEGYMTGIKILSQDKRGNVNVTHLPRISATRCKCT